MTAPVLDVTPKGAAMCSACPRPASFQARVETPRGPEGTGRHANACARHLVGAIQMLQAWAAAHEVTGGWLTVLAIDPNELPWLADRGIAGFGLPFYSAPIARLGLPRPGPAGPPE
jgi:hypothetical protein